ncbi:Imm52 family immunity protein [Streptomyces sp. NPDC055681]
MRRVVRGFWGPREESVDSVARRWEFTLDRLAESLPAAGSGAGWTWRQIHSSGPATDLVPDKDSLLAALHAVREADGWSARVGFGLRLVLAGQPDWTIEVSGNGGGTSEFLLQSMVIGIRSPDTAEIPDADLLGVVAEAWEPDFGDVTDDDVLDALEDDAGFAVGEPCVGWVGCLSPARAALLPEAMTAAGRELRSGGVLLAIAPRGDVEGVVRANLQLRDAGALQPLPSPMDRATL